MQNNLNLESMTLQQLLDEGLHCYHDGQLEQALLYFETLLKMANGNTELLHTIVKLLQEMRDFSKAVIYGEKLLELSPEDDDFLLSQAENYFLLNDCQKSLHLYLKLHQKHPSSLHLLNRFTLIYNEGVNCLSSLQVQLLAESNLEKGTLVTTALFLSEALLNKNELDKSKVILESLLAIEQGNVEVFGLYGIYLEKVNKYEKAIFYLDRAVNDARFKYLSVLTKCLEMAFNIPAVVYYLEKLVEKFPNFDVNKKLLGFYYYRNDDYESAERIFSSFPVFPEDDVYLFKYKTLSRFKVMDNRSGVLDKNDLISLMNDFFSLWKHLPQDEQVSSNLVLFYLNFGEIEKAYDICLKLDKVIPGNLTNEWNKHVYFSAKGNKTHYFNSYLAGRHVRYRNSWDIVKDKVWNGEDIKNKRVLVLREQGIGDELLFASNYSWLVEKAAHIDIFCSSRLKGVFSDAFPAIQFHSISEQTFDSNDPDIYERISKADKVILSGDLPSFLYQEVGACLYNQVYLKINDAKNKHWNDKLELLVGKDKPRIGLIWRSGFVNGSRSKHYLDIYEVAEIISALPEAEFVSCMYVECDDEIRAIEKVSGRKIHQIDELDQKNDFENTAAMISSLDLMVGAYTATTAMAAAVGTDLVMYESDYLKEDGKIEKESLFYKNAVHISLPMNDYIKRADAVAKITSKTREKLYL